MKNRTSGLFFALTLTLTLAGCGGGGCDAGKPAFGNVAYDCPATVSPPASAASAGK